MIPYTNHHSGDVAMSLLEFVQNHGHGLFVKNDHWGRLFSSLSPNVGWLQKATPCADFAIPIQRLSSNSQNLKQAKRASSDSSPPRFSGIHDPKKRILGQWKICSNNPWIGGLGKPPEGSYQH
jgi:hypothetical protein